MAERPPVLPDVVRISRSPQRCPPYTTLIKQLKTTSLTFKTTLIYNSKSTLWRGWGDKRSRGWRWWTDATHKGPCQWKLCISLMETWRWRRMRRWFWLEYYKGTDKERMHATLLKCPHADGRRKKKTKHHLLIMLTKHNYANCHHDHMCTSLGLIGARFLSEVGGKWVLHFYLFAFFLLYKHFHGHVITVVPKTWEVQC